MSIPGIFADIVNQYRLQYWVGWLEKHRKTPLDYVSVGSGAQPLMSAWGDRAASSGAGKVGYSVRAASRSRRARSRFHYHRCYVLGESSPVNVIKADTKKRKDVS